MQIMLSFVRFGCCWPVGDNIHQDVFFFFPSQVLALFNAPAREYTCVFTAGATSALKLVGETFPWSSKSEYLYMMQNHKSVLGIQEHAFFIWSLI
jgi:hypothetical protein